MAINDFKALAIGGGANVITQAEFEALVTLIANGFTSGVVPSNVWNKVARQSSVVASAVAQYIADSGLDALDDGSAATLLANLKTAISLQIDGRFSGKDPKDSVRMASTANIASLSGLSAIDGVTPVAGDRILLKNQTTGSQNGIYVAAAGAWARSADASTGTLSAGATVPVTEGSANGDTLWLLTTNDPIVVGTTSLVFVSLGGISQATADTLYAPISQKSVDVRQTVLSGPTDTSGNPAFGGAPGSTTVTASGTLVVTAANGYASPSGARDRVSSIINPSWTGLSNNGRMPLYLDLAADGTCTTATANLMPVYRLAGADVVTNGQFTFNVSEMSGKVGNGSAAAQIYRVCVGEVTVSGGVVTAIKWYALKGRYHSGRFAVAALNSYPKDHVIGTNPDFFNVKCLGAGTVGGPLGEFLRGQYFNGSTNSSNWGAAHGFTELTSFFSMGAFPYIVNGTITQPVAVEATVSIDRGW